MLLWKSFYSYTFEIVPPHTMTVGAGTKMKTRAPIKSNAVRVLTKAPRHEDVSRTGGIAPRILNTDTRRRWVVTFTPRPLYSNGKRFRYSETQSGSRRGGEERKFHHCPCWKLTSGRPARSLFSILTELPPLRDLFQFQIKAPDLNNTCIL
jgi:hypothetical protein